MITEKEWLNNALVGAAVGAAASFFTGKKKGTLRHAATFGAYGAAGGLAWHFVSGKMSGEGKHLVGHGREHMPYGFPADFTGEYRAGGQSGPAIVGVQSGPAIVGAMDGSDAHLPYGFPADFTGAASYEGGGLVAEFPNAPQQQPMQQEYAQPVQEEIVYEAEPWRRPWHHPHHHRWDRWGHRRWW